MPRAPRPDDLFRLRIATEPRLSPDGSVAVVTVQTVAPGFDGYRRALWLVPTDGSRPPRPLTLGARHDRHPRFSPDGRTLAFISDRRRLLDEEIAGQAPEGKVREDRDQVHLLPLDGGEARRLTDLPRGVEAFEWAPDGSRLVVVSASHGATQADDRRRRGLDRPEPGSPPASDYRFVDRLDYMLNGKGFIYDRVMHLWLVDVGDGTATRLTDGRTSDTEPAWSPDGTRIAFTSNRRRDADLVRGRGIHVVDAASRAVTAVSGKAPADMFRPTWLPDGRTIAALGHRYAGRAGSRNDIWLFASDGGDAARSGGRNLSAPHDLMPGSGMGSDLVPSEVASLIPSTDGRWLGFTAPVAGAYELWRIAIDDGRVERLTNGRHYVSAWHAVPGGRRRRRHADRLPALELDRAVRPVAARRRAGRGASATPRRLTSFNAEVLADIELREPVERHATVDGRDIQGWFLSGG